MSRKPKKLEEDDDVRYLVPDEDEDSDEVVDEPEDTAEIDFDRRRARDWETLDELVEDDY